MYFSLPFVMTDREIVRSCACIHKTRENRKCFCARVCFVFHHQFQFTERDRLTSLFCIPFTTRCFHVPTTTLMYVIETGQINLKTNRTCMVQITYCKLAYNGERICCLYVCKLYEQSNLFPTSDYQFKLSPATLLL